MTGAGTALYLAGSCFHPAQPIRQLKILVGEQAHPVLAHFALRSNASAESSSTDSDSQSLPGEFWGIVAIPSVAGATTIELSVQATLGDGQSSDVRTSAAG